MSLFAGIVSRRGTPVPNSVCEKLHEAISRDRSDVRTVFSDHSVYLVKVDYGSFGSSAYSVDANTGSVVMVAGEPLLSCGSSSGQTRDVDARSIQAELDRGSFNVLHRATGIFAAVHYSPLSDSLVLLTDKLGLRPVYCFVGEEYVIFATSFRILEQVSEIPKTMDVVGVTEIAGSPSYPSNDRTRYVDIKRLRPAEMLRVDKTGKVRREYYWDWRKPLGEEPLAVSEALTLTHEFFMSAIRRRLRNDEVVPACLSGGLDSRSVVAGLRSLGVAVHTFTFYSKLDSQDRVLAQQFAMAAETRHTAIHLDFWESGKSFERGITEAWLDSLRDAEMTARRPRLLWTGDGGSVTLGHLLAESHILAAVRARNFEGALVKHRRGALVSGIVRPELSRDIAHLMVADFRSQLEWADAGDLASAYHLYLIRNHQRNDFTEHFEHLDQHQLEFQSPFYDSDFVAAVLRIPADACTGHKFYHDWMKLLPKMGDAPWQTYPGHEPCPLPVPPHILSQWQDASEQNKRDVLRRRLLKHATSMLLSSNFAAPLLRRPLLGLAVLLHGARLRNCHSALNAFALYQDAWTKSRGRYAIAATSSALPVGEHEYVGVSSV